jgi:hypothetical protein
VPVPPPSALSIAANGVADAIDAHFRRNGAVVHVFADTPAASAKRAAADAHIINLFFYRISPSGFHAAQTANDPLMLRLHCLVTPFCRDGPAENDGDVLPAGEAELRLLGEVVRLFHEHPIVGPLAASGAASAARYALQAVLRAPDMEEINHVWTTQGNDLPYRASAAYEFALAAVDPAVFVEPAPPVRGFRGEIDPHMGRASGPVGETMGLDAWTPALMFVVGAGQLTDALTLIWTEAQFQDNPDEPVTVALAGIVGESAVLQWERLEAGAWTRFGDAASREVATSRLNDPAAHFAPALPAVSAPAELRLFARPVAGGAVSNVLRLNVLAEGGP